MTKKLLQPAAIYLADFQPDGAEWKDLESEGGVTLSVDLKKRLYNAICEYRCDNAAYSDAVRPGKVREVLENIAKVLHQLDSGLSKVLESGDESSLAALREIRLSPVLSNKPYISPTDLEHFHYQARTIAEHADTAIARIEGFSDDKGRPGDPYKDNFLIAALDVYHLAGGKGIYTGKAKAFLKIASKIAGYSVHSDAALEQAIKLARNKSGKTHTT